MKSKKIVFYSCFFGGDNNWAKVLPPCPSEKYDCIFYTNNKSMLSLMEGTKWIPIFLENVPIHNCNIKDAMESKVLKATPHLFPELEAYTYTCYSDSKQWVDDKKVEELVEELSKTDKCIIFARHPLDFKSVWGEFNLAMKYPKYSSQREMSEKFLNDSISNGYSETIENHYVTGFIIRKNSYDTISINNDWYEAILKCGIECQISFSIVQQKYKDKIFSIPYQYCYGFV